MKIKILSNDPLLANGLSSAGSSSVTRGFLCRERTNRVRWGDYEFEAKTNKPQKPLPHQHHVLGSLEFPQHFLFVRIGSGENHGLHPCKFSWAINWGFTSGENKISRLRLGVLGEGERIVGVSEELRSTIDFLSNEVDSRTVLHRLIVG